MVGDDMIYLLKITVIIILFTPCHFHVRSHLGRKRDLNYETLIKLGRLEESVLEMTLYVCGLLRNLHLSINSDSVPQNLRCWTNYLNSLTLVFPSGRKRNHHT